MTVSAKPNPTYAQVCTKKKILKREIHKDEKKNHKNKNHKLLTKKKDQQRLRNVRNPQQEMKKFCAEGNQHNKMY